MSEIKMVPVKSSQIKAIGHDASTKTLAIEFSSGGIYHYADVPAEKYHALLQAESKGKHLHRHIKGAHAFTKIT